jgi:hypothetical protein
MALGPNQIIAAICPELSGSPSLPVFLEIAVEVTDRGFFGKMYPYALAYRACHLFMVSGGAASNGVGGTVAGLGQIASMSEGGLSVSLATGGVSDPGGLDTTKYGKMLLGLIKSRPTMGVNMAGLPPHGGLR